MPVYRPAAAALGMQIQRDALHRMVSGARFINFYPDFNKLSFSG